MVIQRAIILAGGLGTRLRSAVPDLPKCLASVAGRPFLAFLIDELLRQQVQHLVFAVGYKRELIASFLDSYLPREKWSLSVEEEPLGTGGAIRQAAAVVPGSEVLVLNGDTFFEVDLYQLSAYHRKKQADCTLSLKPMHDFDRYGVVRLNADGSIRCFEEKKWYAEGLINGGVYALNPLRLIAEALPEKFSFEQDYLQADVGQRALFGLAQDRYFIDIGIPEDYNRAQTEMARFNL